MTAKMYSRHRRNAFCCLLSSGFSLLSSFFVASCSCFLFPLLLVLFPGRILTFLIGILKSCSGLYVFKHCRWHHVGAKDKSVSAFSNRASTLLPSSWSFLDRQKHGDKKAECQNKADRKPWGLALPHATPLLTSHTGSILAKMVGVVPSSWCGC